MLRRRIFTFLTLIFIAFGLLWSVRLQTHDPRAILGGDIELVQAGKPLPLEAVAFLSFYAENTSYIVELENEAQLEGRNIPVHVKAIDHAYPLVAKIALKEPHLRPVYGRLPRSDVWGAAVNSAFLHQSGLKQGQTFKMGDVVFSVQAVIAGEPDHPEPWFFPSLSQAPRVIIAPKAMRLAGLQKTGEKQIYRARALLPPETNRHSWMHRYNAQFMDAEWRIYFPQP